MIVEVILNSEAKELNRVFDYHVPEELESKISIGTHILVPFARRKQYEEGFVVGIKETSPFRVKDIARIEKNALTEEKVNLAKWMAKRYFCNLSDCIKLMLPPGSLRKNVETRAKEKTENFIYCTKTPEEVEEAIRKRELKSDKHIRALRFLQDNENVTLSDLEMFADVSRAVAKTLEKNGWVEIIARTVERNPFLNRMVEKKDKLVFNEEQKKAFDAIQDSIKKQEYQKFLLYGITGSGKTEIYLQLIEELVNQGKSAILLVPEISLTPQMVNRFLERFGEEHISVLHSKLSIGERFDAWQKIQKTESHIVIGARSAIFAPIHNLGIIIMDEEHDSSYKSEMTPRYDAKELAERIAKLNHIPLVLGSATPSVVSFWESEEGKTKRLALTKRANHASLPEVEIVDLRDELANGNRSMISRKLYEEIEKNIKQKRQTILFLNRRGFSTFIMCRECGYIAKCKNCNISLTYHKKEGKLKCHYCGYEENLVTTCPECKSDKIRYFGAGTQKLEQEIHKIFPKATTIRMDIDTVTKKNSHEQILKQFQEEKIDILIGTQMIVKGHHFPNVTLVGVVAADGMLNMEDYRAGERAFDLLVQVAGRAGRGDIPGKVIIQTYNPDHFCIQYAKKQDYSLFYDAEIGLRKLLKYPPFYDIIVIGVSSLNQEEAWETSNFFYNDLEKRLQKEEIILLKPLPAPIDKIKNRYRYRLLIKCHLKEEIIQEINEALIAFYEENKKDVYVAVDVNPTNML